MVADRLPAADWCDGAAEAVFAGGPSALWLSALCVFQPGGWVALAVTPTRHLLAAQAAAVALTAGHAGTAADLIHAADMALLAAKARGKNGIRLAPAA